MVVKPETVVRWHRMGFRIYWRFISNRCKNRGRNKIDRETRPLIGQMSKENPTWRAPRIHGELLKLGFKISERTVSRYLPKKEPDGEKIKKWMALLLILCQNVQKKQFFCDPTLFSCFRGIFGWGCHPPFLNSHMKGIAAMDFFIVPTLFFKRLYCFFIIHHDKRKIFHFNVTFHPIADWVIHQLRNAFLINSIPRYMIFDRDSIFSSLVKETMKSLGIEPVRTSYRSPWQNGVAERWIGSCRRELLNHVIILNKNHLYKLLEEYIEYYNEDRTHYSLDKDPPSGRPVLKRNSDED